MTTCFSKVPASTKKEAEKVLSQVRTASFRLILKELIKEYGDIIIFIIMILSGSYLWLWNRHRPVAMGDCSKCANHSVVCHDGVLDNLGNYFMFLAFKKFYNLNINKNDKVILLKY